MGGAETGSLESRVHWVPSERQAVAIRRSPSGARKAGPGITALLVQLMVERPLEPVRGGGAPKLLPEWNLSAVGVRWVRGTGECFFDRSVTLGVTWPWVARCDSIR